MHPRSARPLTAIAIFAAGASSLLLVALTVFPAGGSDRVDGPDPVNGSDRANDSEPANGSESANGSGSSGRPGPAGGAEVGHAELRARRLTDVAAWPSDEGQRFVERYSRDLEGLSWAVGVLVASEYEHGALDEPRRTALVESLRDAPWERVRAELYRAADRDAVDEADAAAGLGGPAGEAPEGEQGLPDGPRLAAVIELFEALGDAADVEPLVELCLSRAEGADEPEVLDALERALARILQDDPRTVQLLPDLFRPEHRPLWRTLASAVGRSREVAALGQLARLLTQDRELDGLLITQMGRLGTLADPAREWHVCFSVRGFLVDERPGVRREAALTLGRLRDGESTEGLLELLDDENEGVRKSALWALREVSGRDLGEDPRRWRAWFIEELVWWDETYPTLLDVLREGTPEEIGPAVAELQLRALFRHTVAADLGELLSHEAPELRLRACVALRELGSLAPARALTAALEDTDPNVRARALEALRAISGLELGADRAAWVEALEIEW